MKSSHRNRLVSRWVVWLALVLASVVLVSKRTAHASQSSSPSPWYFYISAGAGEPRYDDTTQANIAAQKAKGGESPQAGFIELPGVYRRLTPELALGGILVMSFENVASDWHGHDSYAVQTYNTALSLFAFPGGNLGNGWFGRADLGVSRFFERKEFPESQQLRSMTSNRDGIFSQAVIGYGWQASRFSSVLVHLNALLLAAGPARASGITFNIGLLL